MIRRLRSRRGFTLVELLVVIAIIGILVSLLLPAINGVRAMARRMQCGSNLREVGQALLTHEETYGAFPPGVPICGETTTSVFTAGGSEGCEGPTWIMALFPFIEEPARFDLIKECVTLNAFCSVACPEYKVNMNTQPPQTGIGMNTPTIMICPSATTLDLEYNLNSGTDTPKNVAKGNVAGNFGAGVWQNPKKVPQGLSDATEELKEELRTGPPNRGFFGVVDIGQPAGIGRLGSKKGTLQSSVRDGMTKTIMISEILGYRSQADGRGAWMWSGMGGASFTALLPPNATGTGANHPLYDYVRFCGAAGGSDVDQEKFQCTPATNDELGTYAAARSEHTGGVNVVFGDKHVEFMSETVDPRIWKAFCTINGPKIYNKSNFAVWVEPDAQPGEY